MNIYVGNLPLETTADELREQFMAFGEVVSVSIQNDSRFGSGQSRGFAYVEMMSKAEGKEAIAGLTGKILWGRVVNVIESLPVTTSKLPRRQTTPSSQTLTPETQEPQQTTRQ